MERVKRRRRRMTVTLFEMSKWLVNSLETEVIENIVNDENPVYHDHLARVLEREIGNID